MMSVLLRRCFTSYLGLIVTDLGGTKATGDAINVSRYEGSIALTDDFFFFTFLDMCRFKHWEGIFTIKVP